jgi:uncharacterized protein YjbI with pentapeptide repeats
MLINGYEIKPGADLRGVNLSGADLSGANLSNANLQGANLGGTNLTGTRLKGANLFNAFMHGANLWGANLIGANVNRTNVHMFSLGKDTAFIHEKVFVVGCSSASIEGVNRRVLRKMGELRGYTPAEIRHYTGHIMFTIKLLKEGVIS